MRRKDSRDDLEERADQLLNSVLNLSQGQVDVIYSAERPNEDSTQRIFDLAELAARRCEAAERPQPPQLKEALAALRQLELPLDSAPQGMPDPGLLHAQPRVLLIDEDADRLLALKRLFREKRIDTEVAMSPAEGLDLLETGVFQLVIVDYYPNTEDERNDLMMLQRFNLQVPIINVSAWARLAHADNGRLNHELLRLSASVFGRPVPKRLPVKRASDAACGQPNETLFEDTLFKEQPETGT